jgi:hypothetical protein
MDELFEIITKIIASPHNVITEHDKRRAIQVFLGFDDYLIDNVPEYCGDTEFVRLTLVVMLLPLLMNLKEND